MMFGPSGHPFEDFVARVLGAVGYKTKVRQVLSGQCISHEIDVVAEKDGKTSIIEVKFHNSPGTRSEVQTVLYTNARFQDVKVRNKVDDVWLITNTKATIDATTYAHCAGMKVISWDYPREEGLRDLIERFGLHPITLLSSLSHSQKMTLLENDIILCRDIIKNPISLNILYLSHEQHEKVLTEAGVVCRVEGSKKSEFEDENLDEEADLEKFINNFS
jgi:Holliday junction resolvase-like predicted endonuclease